MTRSRIPAAIAAASAAASLALLAGPASAATATTTPTPAPTTQPAPAVGSLSIRAVRSVVRPGHQAVIDGALAAPNTSVAGKSVTLQELTGGATTWTTVTTATTRDFGGITTSVPVTGPTRFRWVFAGDSTITPATSGVVTVHTSPRAGEASRFPSSLSIRLREPLRVGGRTLVVGSLHGHGTTLPHEQVLLLVRRANEPWWTVTQAHRTNWNGHVRFVVNAPAGASYRLAFLGDRRFQPTESGIVRVTTTAAPTVLRIGGRTVTSGFAITGRLVSRGFPVRGQAVILQQQNADGTWASIASHVTDGNGRIRFVEPTSAGTAYQLLFVGTDAWSTSTSATVTQP